MKLPKRTYPHIDDTDFPLLENENVWKYHNDFNYARWSPNTRVKICNVNFYSDYKDVVKFDTDTQRNNFFDNLSGTSITLTTASSLVPDNSVKLPVPADVLSKYNYLYVTLPLMTPDGTPLNYENSSNRVNKFFYFIENIEAINPNNTKLYLKLDTWTTYINKVSINYMMLTRGHAPLWEMPVDNYLANPLENNRLLLAEDVTAGENTKIADIRHVDHNSSEMNVVFVTTADHRATWNTGVNWNTPTNPNHVNQGALSYQVFAIAIADFNTFISNASTNLPNFFQTVQGIFCIAKKYITYTYNQTFCGVTTHGIDATYKTEQLFRFAKNDFNYPTKYKNIAKLYTYPYAYVEIQTEAGDKTLIKIEETNNNVEAITHASLFFPYIKLQSIITGVGSNTTSTITFKNLSDSTFFISGKSLDIIKTWNIPIYDVVQSGERYTVYNSYFDRRQMATQRDNDKTNADVNANVNYTIATRSASTAQTNANAQITANDAILNYAKGTADLDTLYSNELNSAQQAYSVALNNATTARSVQQNWETTGISVATATASGALTGAMAGTMVPVAGNIVGAGVGAAVGALGGLLSAGATSGIGTLITNNAKQDIVNAVNGISSDKTASVNQNNNDKNDLQNAFKTDQWNTQKACNQAQIAVQYSSDTSNASDLRNAGLDISARNKGTIDSQIDNLIKQGGLNAPAIFGSIANGETETLRSKGLFAKLVTINDGILSQVGDQFLRYGYMLNQQWEVTDLKVMEKFTYWKAEDLYVNCDEGVIEEAKKEIRNIFVNGVTVWGSNADIGRTSIYDNGI